jgi:hypothetical protein
MAFKWQDTILSILNNVTAKAEVTIEKNWNPTTREISGNVNVQFLSAVDPGDFRINLYIVEDSVVGDTGNYKYDQKNNYINDNTYPELYGKILIRNYVHRNVVRDAPLGDWGKSGTIPSSPVISNIYSAPFSYTLPAKYDNVMGRDVLPRHIKLVGFVSYYDANTWKRRILNSVAVSLTNGATGISNPTAATSINIYPNPAGEMAQFEINLSCNDEVSVELFDITGRKTAELFKGNLNKGSYSLDINTGILKQGQYICIVKTKDSVVSKQIAIIH